MLVSLEGHQKQITTTRKTIPTWNNSNTKHCLHLNGWIRLWQQTHHVIPNNHLLLADSKQDWHYAIYLASICTMGVRISLNKTTPEKLAMISRILATMRFMRYDWFKVTITIQLMQWKHTRKHSALFSQWQWAVLCVSLNKMSWKGHVNKKTCILTLPGLNYIFSCTGTWTELFIQGYTSTKVAAS